MIFAGNICRRIFIDRMIHLHGATHHVFRHTYITLAASSGMGVKTLQSIAGHSDIKMILDCYAHKREINVIAAGGLMRAFSSRCDKIVIIGLMSRK